LFCFGFDEFCEFAVCDLFSIVLQGDCGCCHSSFFDAFVGGHLHARYGDPDHIVISVERCGAGDFGINNALGERCHDVITAACHRLSSGTFFVPRVGHVVSLLAQ